MGHGYRESVHCFCATRFLSACHPFPTLSKRSALDVPSAALLLAWVLSLNYNNGMWQKNFLIKVFKREGVLGSRRGFNYKQEGGWDCGFSAKLKNGQLFWCPMSRPTRFLCVIHFGMRNLFVEFSCESFFPCSFFWGGGMFLNPITLFLFQLVWGKRNREAF